MTWIQRKGINNRNRLTARGKHFDFRYDPINNAEWLKQFHNQTLQYVGLKRFLRQIFKWNEMKRSWNESFSSDSCNEGDNGSY